MTTQASTLPDRDRITDLDSHYSWMRLAASVLLGTIGGVGIWSVVVVLPAVQAEFTVSRAEASLPFTLTMIGFAFGGILMGRLTDRFGIALPVAGAALSLGCGYIAAGLATTLWHFALAHGLLIGLLGSSATFGPLISDISHWFARRRGFALATWRVRQLPRRRDLAADRAALRFDRRLAPDPYLHRAVLRCHHAAAGADATAPFAARRRRARARRGGQRAA